MKLQRFNEFLIHFDGKILINNGYSFHYVLILCQVGTYMLYWNSIIVSMLFADFRHFLLDILYVLISRHIT